MNQSDPSQNDGPAKVIVLLPAADDPIRDIASGDHPHTTLFYLGDESTDMERLQELVQNLARTGYTYPPAFDRVAGEGYLGENRAHVYFLDGSFSASVRELAEGDQWLMDELAKAEQFPNWTPHITIGYDDAPGNLPETYPEGVVYDRIAIFSEGEVIEFPFAFDEPEGEAVTAAAEPEDEEMDEELEAAVEELQENEGNFEVPCHGVLAPENKPSGDGRMFADDSLSARDLPLPLRWVHQDVGSHDGAVIVGRIDRVWRDNGLIKWDGVFDDSPEAYEAVRQIANGVLRGISVDATDAVMREGDDQDVTVFEYAKLAAATLVAIPAFEDAFIALGTWADEDADSEEDKNQSEISVPSPDKEFSEDAETFVGDKLLPKHMDGQGGSRTMDSCLRENGQQTYSTTDPTTTNAGPGLDTRTAQDTGASTLTESGSLPTGQSTKGELAQSLKERFSTISATTGQGAKRQATAPTGDASTPNTASQSLTRKTSSGGTADTAAVEASARQDFTTSPTQKTGSGQRRPSERASSAGTLRSEKSSGEKRSGDTETDSENFATDKLLPKHLDGPGWVTQPKPTKRITSYWVDGRGAAKIRWGQPNDFNRCRRHLAKYVKNPDWLAGLCANLHHRALGVWPGRHNHSAETVTASASPAVSIVASLETPDELPAEWFKDPKLEGPTPLTITDEGRVFGHVAAWDSCHIGYADYCQTAPSSKTDYAYFAVGETLTTEGPVRTGKIVMGGPHANPRAAAMAAFHHYAATSSAVADVAVGEDVFGIWVAGALRDGLDKKALRALRASPLSGDWRPVRLSDGTMNQELVAALAVNIPGFGIPRRTVATEGKKQLSLLAAGIVPPSLDETRDKLASLRSTMRAHQAAKLKSDIGF